RADGGLARACPVRQWTSAAADVSAGKYSATIFATATAISTPNVCASLSATIEGGAIDEDGASAKLSRSAHARGIRACREFENLARRVSGPEAAHAAHETKRRNAVTDDEPYEVLSPTKIRLGPVAKELAAQHGMSLTEMARYLLTQEKLRDAGLTQREGE